MRESAPHHDSEPVPGLPGALPEGEKVLWSGVPDWRVLARRALLARAVALYFAALMVWRAATVANDGAGATLEGLGQGLLAASTLLPLLAAAVGILAGIAYLTAKSTIYTITNRRVVLRYGVAMTLCVNVPFSAIGSAALRRLGDGYGDIPLKLSTHDKFSYLMLWPNARPWRFTRPEPMLRAVPDAERVAGVLAAALREHAGQDAAAAAPIAEAPRRPAAETEGAGRGAFAPAAASPR